MKISTKKNYILISTEETSFSAFFKNFNKKFNEIKNKHIIIRISVKNNFTEKNILLFLEHANTQHQNAKSFVVVDNTIEVDNFPENFNIVPTLTEAEDVIEMEDIQRNLGF
ncbi:MAG: hypothetical protein ACK5H1_02395 [Tenacibaculum sp.]